MHLRSGVVLCVASALSACGPFDATAARDGDAVRPNQDGDDPVDPHDGEDGGEQLPENDSVDSDRDAGHAPGSDGTAPGDKPSQTAEGGPAPTAVDAGFAWASDGALPSTHDASTSVRDGGLIKFDPDASGPVLNHDAQAACIGLLNNVCNRSADCQVSLLGLESAMRARLFESCRNSLWRARNCNRATRIASGFAQCSESTKNLGCVSVLATDLSVTCGDQLTLQPSL